MVQASPQRPGHAVLQKRSHNTRGVDFGSIWLRTCSIPTTPQASNYHDSLCKPHRHGFATFYGIRLIFSSVLAPPHIPRARFGTCFRSLSADQTNSIIHPHAHPPNPHSKLSNLLMQPINKPSCQHRRGNVTKSTHSLPMPNQKIRYFARHHHNA